MLYILSDLSKITTAVGYSMTPLLYETNLVIFFSSRKIELRTIACLCNVSRQFTKNHRYNHIIINFCLISFQFRNLLFGLYDLFHFNRSSHKFKIS